MTRQYTTTACLFIFLASSPRAYADQPVVLPAPDMGQAAGEAMVESAPKESPRLRAWSLWDGRWNRIEKGTRHIVGPVLFAARYNRQTVVSVERDGLQPIHLWIDPSRSDHVPPECREYLQQRSDEHGNPYFLIEHPTAGGYSLSVESIGGDQGSANPLEFRLVPARPRISAVYDDDHLEGPTRETVLGAHVVRTAAFVVVVDGVPDGFGVDFSFGDERVMAKENEGLRKNGRRTYRIAPEHAPGRYRLAARLFGQRAFGPRSHPEVISYEPRLGAIVLNDVSAVASAGKSQLDSGATEQRDGTAGGGDGKPEGDGGKPEGDGGKPEGNDGNPGNDASKPGSEKPNGEPDRAVSPNSARMDTNLSVEGIDLDLKNLKIKIHGLKLQNTVEFPIDTIRRLMGGPGLSGTPSGPQGGEVPVDPPDKGQVSTVAPFPSPCSDGSCDPEFDPNIDEDVLKQLPIVKRLAFREPAHFPLVTPAHRARTSVEEGAIVDGMTLSIKKNGAYEVKYRVTTGRKVRVRLDLLVRCCAEQCVDGQKCIDPEPRRWHVIALPTRTVEANPGQPCEVCIYGQDAFLHALYSQGSRPNLELRRRGSAEFGTVPEVALTR